MNFYKAFGLSIESEISLPELLSGTGPGEVCIRKGPVARLEEIDVRGRNFRLEMSEGRFVFEVTQVARFLVREGCEVRVDPAAGASAEDVRLFLLGSVFGALLIQRGSLALHGSAIDYKGRAIAFLGPSGAGKSTLANAFRVYGGVSLISDDVCALGLGGPDLPQVYPGYPQSKLWRDSLAMLGIEGNSLRQVGSRVDKRALPVREYVLELGESASAIEPVVGAEKALILSSETYRSEFVGGLGMRTRHFANVAEVVNRVPIRRLIRPATACDAQAVMRRVERDLEAFEF